MRVTKRIEDGTTPVASPTQPRILLNLLAEIMGKSGQKDPAFPNPELMETVSPEEQITEDPVTEALIGAQIADVSAAVAHVPDGDVSLGGLKLTYHTVSSTGLVRRRNEDACGLFIPPDANILGTMGVLAVLADGMGGHDGGDRASGLVLESMGKTYYESFGEDPGDALVQAVESAHNAILRESADTGRDMGSTCSALLFQANEVYGAHVGDSRIYRWRDGCIEQLSVDDSMVAEMVRRGIVTPENARRHPDRSVLLNALGQSEELTVSRASTPCELRDGDQFLICSDGLHGSVDDSEIAATLATAGSLAEANEILLRLALERGGTDNISIVLVRVHYIN